MEMRDTTLWERLLSAFVATTIPTLLGTIFLLGGIVHPKCALGRSPSSRFWIGQWRVVPNISSPLGLCLGALMPHLLLFVSVVGSCHISSRLVLLSPLLEQVCVSRVRSPRSALGSTSFHFDALPLFEGQTFFLEMGCSRPLHQSMHTAVEGQTYVVLVEFTRSW
jgi:hypothetical protein